MTIPGNDITTNSLCFIKHNDALDVCLQITYSNKTDNGVKVYGFWWNLGVPKQVVAGIEMEGTKSFNIREWAEFEIKDTEIPNWKFCVKDPSERNSLSLRENSQWV